MLARPAAIKLLRPGVLAKGNEAAAQLAVKRFWREAEAAASLRSQHTVELYDFGVMEDQTVYFVMELLDGMDLEALVRKTGPLPAGRVVYLLTQVCESLEEAHSRGLVHRDIKPANIHIGRMGLRHDYVKVLDFGLVKSVSTNAEDTVGTTDGIHPGTPAYMAPEQAMGEKVDHRVDIYAAGLCRLFHAHRTEGVRGRDTFPDDQPASERYPGASITTHRAADSGIAGKVGALLPRQEPRRAPQSAADLGRRCSRWRPNHGLRTRRVIGGQSISPPELYPSRVYFLVPAGVLSTTAFPRRIPSPQPVFETLGLDATGVKALCWPG